MNSPDNSNENNDFDENFVDPETVANAIEAIREILMELTMTERMEVFKKLSGRI